MVTMHHNCCGSEETPTLTVADVLLTTELVPTAFPLASSLVLTSTLIPAEGIAEVKVTAKFNAGPGLSTLLPALCVKAIGGSVGGGGGGGLLEPQLSNSTITESNMNIFSRRNFMLSVLNNSMNKLSPLSLTIDHDFKNAFLFFA